MNRRRFLIGAGVTTSAAVAGCLGEDDEEAAGDGTDEDDSSDGGEDAAGRDDSDADGDDSSDGSEETDDGPNGDENGADDGDDDGAGDGSAGGDDDGGADGGSDPGDDEGGSDDDTDENGDGDDEGDDSERGGGDGESGGDGGESGGDNSDETDPETRTLEVEIEPESGYSRPPAVSVEVADERIETGEARVSFDLEPGTHTLEAAADGFETAAETVSLEEDATVTLELERQYANLLILDHEVSVVRRDDADDTVEATVVLENRSEFDSTRTRVEASATDQDGDSFGHGESGPRSVPAGERPEVQFKLLRSTGDSFDAEREVDAAELSVVTTGTARTLDTASE